MFCELCFDWQTKQIDYYLNFCYCGLQGIEMQMSSGFEKVFLSKEHLYISIYIFFNLFFGLISCNYKFLIWLLILYAVTIPLNFSVARGGEVYSSSSGLEHK